MLWGYSDEYLKTAPMPRYALGDNLHEKSKPIFWEKIRKYFRMSSVETVTKHAKC